VSRLSISARQRLYHYLFDLKTRSGRRFEGLCGLFALLSVIIIFIESGAGTQYHLTFDEWHVFVWLELAMTLVFTVNICCGILLAEPGKICFQLLGIYRFATILPLYVMWLWPEISLDYVFAWRACAIRVLRILKLCVLCRRYGYSGGDRQRTSSAGTFLFVYRHRDDCFGALMYLIEGPKYGFTTLNASVYWAIVTVTTVGYGDITPHTPLGRIVASVLILIGYSVIAIPTGLITTT
jgi:voltage-gated potassium channel